MTNNITIPTKEKALEILMQEGEVDLEELEKLKYANAIFQSYVMPSIEKLKEMNLNEARGRLEYIAQIKPQINAKRISLPYPVHTAITALKKACNEAEITSGVIALLITGATYCLTPWIIKPTPEADILMKNANALMALFPAAISLNYFIRVAKRKMKDAKEKIFDRYLNAEEIRATNYIFQSDKEDKEKGKK